MIKLENLSHKQRVLKSLSFIEPDRIPLDIGGTNVTSMHIKIEKKLKRYLGFKGRKSIIRSYTQRCVIPDERILKYFDVDTRSIYFGESKPWKSQPDGTFIDEWGIGYKLSPDGYYYDFASHPLKDATLEDLDKYQLPNPYSERRLLGLEKRIEDLGSEYCLMLEGSRECIFGLASWLRGHEQFYMDLLINQKFAEALMDILLDYQKKLLGFILKRIGKDIDIVKVADDLGAQNSLIISPEIYRKLIKPRQAELYRFIKNKCDCKIFLHSDGAIRDIIPDFIEIGIDILNPIQTSAKGMDPIQLKKEFGKKIVFWGGGVETQSTLSFGTPEEVKEDIRKKIEMFKKGGGYVFAQIHNIQPQVPIDNILAMYKAFHKYSSY